MGIPKRKKGINDPVVLVQEERVHGREGGLYDSPGVPACEVLWSWVGFWHPGTFLWAAKATLSSAW